MGRREDIEVRSRVKLQLADKYDRLAKASNSRPKRQTLVNRAERYRRQAEEIRRELAR